MAFGRRYRRRYGRRYGRRFFARRTFSRSRKAGYIRRRYKRFLRKSRTKVPLRNQGQKIIVPMKYIQYDTFSMTVGTIDNWVLRCNSIYDPDYTNVGTQSYPQSSTGTQGYGFYRVIAWTLRVTFGTPDVDMIYQVKCNGGALATSSTPVPRDWMLLPKTRLQKWGFVTHNQLKPKTVVIKGSYKDFYDPYTGQAATVAVNTNPPDANTEWGMIRITPFEPSASGSCPVWIRLYQKVLFTSVPVVTF